jgi:hypothetical protein
MPVKDPKRSADWYFPPDMAALVAPMLSLLVIITVTSGVSWAKSLGDSSLFRVALWLGAFGSATLFLARWPLYRKRRFFTLGPRALSGWHRKLYYVAYALIIPSVALLVILLVSLR